MNRSSFTRAMDRHGDMVITYISPVSKRSKYIVGTLDFNTPYIKNKRKPSDKDDTTLVFCWDSDTFKHIDTQAVTRLEPLQQSIMLRRDTHARRG